MKLKATLNSQDTNCNVPQIGQTGNDWYVTSDNFMPEMGNE